MADTIILPHNYDSRERSQRLNDLCSAKNPLDTDFDVVWDSYRYTFPANSVSTYPRFIIEHYLTKMTDYIILLENRKIIDQENAKRKKKKQSPVDPYNEEPILATNLANKAKRQEIMKELWGGVSKAYGTELYGEKVQQQDKPATDEEIFASLSREETALQSDDAQQVVEEGEVADPFPEDEPNPFPDVKSNQ